MGEAFTQRSKDTSLFGVPIHCTLGVMDKRIPRLRKRYRPEGIMVLFIAESPPESSDDEVRFFYNHRQEKWDYLYLAVMKAVFPEFDRRRGEKERWLHKFQEHGYYLMDATDRPVNRLSSAERRRELERAVKPTLNKIKRLVSPSTPIILVKKNVFSALYRPLRDAGYSVIHESFLPFPSHGRLKEFIRKCRDCLGKAGRAGYDREGR
jgi:hypothetical protein